MPLLLGFLACEKVIFEEGTKSASLIGILHDVYIPVIKSIEVPVGTAIPLNWLAIHYLVCPSGRRWGLV
jgi:hypothetical protein